MSILTEITNLPYNLISDFTSTASLVFGGAGSALGSAISLYVVPQQEVAIVERFGKFRRTMEPGLHLRWPRPIEKVVSHETLRQTQHNFEVNVQTSDHAMVDIPMALLLKIIDPVKAYYEMEDPIQQIEALTGQEVRSITAKRTVDQLFDEKDTISNTVKADLGPKIALFGFSIEDVVVSQPKLKPELIAAYDRVVAAQREQKAAVAEGEAQRIRTVKAAEAEKEAMGLRGEGLRALQENLSGGIVSTVKAITKECPNISQEAALAAAVILNSAAVTDQAAQGSGNVVLTTVNSNDVATSLAALTSRLTPKAIPLPPPAQG